MKHNRHLFVYGLLKKGFNLNSNLKGFNYLGVGKLKDYDMFSCGYFPAIIEGVGVVVGEVYSCRTNDFNKLIKSVDIIESGYKRITQKVKVNDELIDCEVYIFNYKPIGWKFIDSGVFK